MMIRSRGLGSVFLIIGLAVGCTGNRPNEVDMPVETAPPLEQTSTDGPGPTDPDAPMEFTETDSGLKYRILRNADGPKPTAADTVTVNYRGWVDNGTEFDSSYKRGEPATFPLMRVVAGWTEGLQYVPEGGMIELEIPSELGYGQSPPPGSGIQPGDTLHFIVELIKIQ